MFGTQVIKLERLRRDELTTNRQKQPRHAYATYSTAGSSVPVRGRSFPSPRPSIDFPSPTLQNASLCPVAVISVISTWGRGTCADSSCRSLDLHQVTSAATSKRKVPSRIRPVIIRGPASAGVPRNPWYGGSQKQNPKILKLTAGSATPGGGEWSMASSGHVPRTPAMLP
ncbi:hypothetical protein CGRA01v4_07722 [Colletotrichum graminicola]|nr:hypothetical protein CGRA01v4_07722 [Colletotrichum graminicola]